MGEDKAKKALDDRLDRAWDSEAPKLYANGFVARLTNADVTIVLESGPHPVAVVCMSYTLAKTLAQKLGTMLTLLESKTGKEMLTADQVALALKQPDGPPESALIDEPNKQQ